MHWITHLHGWPALGLGWSLVAVPMWIGLWQGRAPLEKWLLSPFTAAILMLIAAFVASALSWELEVNVGIPAKSTTAVIASMMEDATKQKGVMWGSSIAGFGTTTIKYAGGREADWPLVGFSPRKQNLTLYIGLSGDMQTDLLSKLGKHTVGKGCLYIKRLSDVDLPTLKRVINASVKRKGK